MFGQKTCPLEQQFKNCHPSKLLLRTRTCRAPFQYQLSQSHIINRASYTLPPPPLLPPRPPPDDWVRAVPSPPVESTLWQPPGQGCYYYYYCCWKEVGHIEETWAISELNFQLWPHSPGLDQWRGRQLRARLQHPTYYLFLSGQLFMASIRILRKLNGSQNHHTNICPDCPSALSFPPWKANNKIYFNSFSIII